MMVGALSAQTNAGPDVSMSRTVTADNAFGFRLLAETRKSKPGGNVFQSPVGLALALAAVANGADGQTWKEMSHTLGAEGLPLSEFNAGYRALLDHLNAIDPRIKLEIATSIWTGGNSQIKPAFLSRCQEFYRAQAMPLEFGSPAAVRAINDWVGQNTHGAIPTILDSPLPGNTRLIVLNAIYFKAAWELAFDKKLTRDQPFTLRDGGTDSLPRMTLKEKIGYLETSNFQAVVLPYTTRQASLFVFLPKESVDKFMPTLTPQNWEQWTRQFAVREGTLELPRFKLENTFQLNRELETMGMTRAFNIRAEFGGISAEPLQISEVEQKTFIELNEEGTEAAAVSGIRMRPTIAIRQTAPPFTMIVDHPFYIAIRENATGAILFHGTIENPTSQ
jgi:serpin B